VSGGDSAMQHRFSYPSVTEVRPVQPAPPMPSNPDRRSQRELVLASLLRCSLKQASKR
jgi:hypothetical protein